VACFLLRTLSKPQHEFPMSYEVLRTATAAPPDVERDMMVARSVRSRCLRAEAMSRSLLKFSKRWLLAENYAASAI
jgi:hypothetical protein